jgi:hypothetical protein
VFLEVISCSHVDDIDKDVGALSVLTTPGA